jgi:uncharacterized phage protein gp47/JayE
MPAGVRTCVNPEAFVGGDDAESDDELRQRVLDSFQRLPNGANAAYYEQTALSFPGVAAATAVGRPRGVGSVDVYIATNAGVPGDELLSEVQDYLQKRREISVDLQVKAPETAPVNVTVAVLPAKSGGFTAACAAVDQALRELFTGELLGQGLTLAKLGDAVYHAEGVSNYRITSPSADIAASSTILPTLGTVTIKEWTV